MDKEYRNILAYIIVEVLVIILAFIIARYYPFNGYIYVAIVMILISLLGDYFIYLIIKEKLNKDKEEVIIKEHERNYKENELFYKFCDVQQTNIRHYYHDINNHLITLKLLKDSNKKEEYDKYLENIKEEYNKTILKDTSEDVLLDIIVQYYLKEDINIKIIGKSNNIDYIKLLEILNELKKDNNKIIINFNDNSISTKIISINKDKYNEYIFKELNND